MDFELKSELDILIRVMAAQEVQAMLLCEIVANIKPHLDQKTIVDEYNNNLNQRYEELLQSLKNEDLEQ